jgi:asparagine synthase (glutamine-hydrolysing)
MCGICGIIDFSERPVEAGLIDRMRDMMRNRGPDDAGTQVLPHAGLGHRRLSILDLSPRGHQPMSNEEGTIWLVFNGEIYNFADLRAELEQKGHIFRSETDSEVLIHGYEQWGLEGLLEQINGMFAFAVWDAPRRRLSLARDRLGKKPLYYGRRDGRFLYASDMKALWAYAPGEWRPRMESIARFLFWRYLPGEEAIYEDTYQLPPAHYLVLDEAGFRISRYWRLSFADKIRGNSDEVMDRTEAAIAAAVSRRLRSDVPLGAFLSGGVDSSLVVSYMANGNDYHVRTFSMGTEDPDHDERRAARIVARHCHTEHTEFQVTPDAWSLLPRLVWEFGQPFGDAAAIPTYYVSECARRYVTVALTGDGGDESFAGYSNHQGYYLAAFVSRWLPGEFLDGVLAHGRPLLDSGRQRLTSSAARFLRYAHSDPMISLAPVTSWALHHLDHLWASDARRLTDRGVLLDNALDVIREFDGENPLDWALHYDLGHLLPYCYNVKVDVATMMASLEARSPFQDREVVEWAARIDPSIKMRPWEKKHLLKRLAARRVPREVIYRPKHGFSIPMDAWFRGSWAEPARKILLGPAARSRGLFNYPYIERLWDEHLTGRARHGTRFWLLLWLELWFRMFVDRSLQPGEPMPSA